MEQQWRILAEKLKELKRLEFDVTLTYLASIMGTLNEWDERRRRKRKRDKPESNPNV